MSVQYIYSSKSPMWCPGISLGLVGSDSPVFSTLGLLRDFLLTFLVNVHQENWPQPEIYTDSLSLDVDFF